MAMRMCSTYEKKRIAAISLKSISSAPIFVKDLFPWLKICSNVSFVHIYDEAPK
jgi:hypothetical protein